MSESLWLSLAQGAPVLSAPLLLEHQHPYRLFHNIANSIQVILLIRGDRKKLLSPEAGDAIQLRKVAPQAFVADCCLHLGQAIPRANGKLVPPNISQYHLQDRAAWSREDLSYSIYSNLLAPFGNVVVFFEEEHGGLPGVLRILAAWIWFAPEGEDLQWHIPRVLIYQSTRTEPGALEEALAAEILQNFNHQKTLTFRAAKSAWRRCFRSIASTARESAEFPLEGILHESASVQQARLDSRRGFGAHVFKSVFRASCAHFAREFGNYSLLGTCFSNAVPGDMSVYVEQVAKAAGPDKAHLSARLIASAFVSASYRSCSLYFPPETVYAQIYCKMLRDIQGRAAVPDLEVLTKTAFLKLAAEEELQKPPILFPWCKSLPAQHAQGSCLTCLLRIATNPLSCGHRLCDECALSYERSDLLGKCPLCACVNEMILCPKPSAAGVRVLQLSGTTEDALGMAQLLRTLRSSLSGPLKDSFDLVVCSGVGLFFAVMIFCNGATIEDCIHHVGSLRGLKEAKDGFSFGSRVKFKFCELRQSPVRIVACLKRRVVPNYISPDMPTASSAEVAQRECERFWPSSKIDVLVNIPDGARNEAALLPIVGSLYASSLYVELREDPVFLGNSPVTVHLTLKCRIPPGPAFLDFLMRLHLKKCSLFCSTDNTSASSTLACPRSAWLEAKHSGRFLRHLQIQIRSLASEFNVQVDDVHDKGLKNISNCPSNIRKLLAESTSARDKIEKPNAIFESLEAELAILCRLTPLRSPE